MTKENQEEFSNSNFNTASLLNSYKVVGNERSKEVNAQTKDEENIEGALMYTYVQAMDSYREGTIDGVIEDSLNGEHEVPRTTFSEDLE
jgi:hypothetical protein